MDHRRREEFPAISNYTGEKQMGKLSIFIDESGDFGEIKERPAYYLVTFVFHDQNKNIDKQVLKLEESVRAAGFDVEYIHTGPVIRREEIFAGYSIDERRKLYAEFCQCLPDFISDSCGGQKRGNKDIFFPKRNFS